MTPGGHPTDADREQSVRPVLADVVSALTRGDGEAFAALLRGDAAWLHAEGRADGPDAAERARTFAPGAQRWWADPQLKGAHAVLRWGGADGIGAEDGALVLELRAGAVVLVVEVP